MRVVQLWPTNNVSSMKSIEEQIGVSKYYTLYELDSDTIIVELSEDWDWDNEEEYTIRLKEGGVNVGNSDSDDTHDVTFMWAMGDDLANAMQVKKAAWDNDIVVELAASYAGLSPYNNEIEGDDDGEE